MTIAGMYAICSQVFPGLALWNGAIFCIFPFLSLFLVTILMPLEPKGVNLEQN